VFTRPLIQKAGFICRKWGLRDVDPEILSYQLFANFRYLSLTPFFSLLLSVILFLSPQTSKVVQNTHYVPSLSRPKFYRRTIAAFTHEPDFEILSTSLIVMNHKSSIINH
jgi:hypothetical protein